ncbi:MAG: hypothetical protein WDA09_10020 [Bacteriovoracaceae bacterium]
MKLTALLLLSLFSMSAFSASVADTVAKLEDGNDVQCYEVSKSRQICLGLAVDEDAKKTIPCWYSVKYECSGAENFTAKLRVKESYNASTDKREQNVTKVTITD